MDKIILKNKTEFEVADGASLGNIQIKTENFEAIKTITDAFTADNLVEVTFTHNGETSGKYTDLRCDGFTYAPNTDEAGKEDGTYTVTIRLRTKNEIEKRLDSLEKGHIANATAIDSIITDIIPGMEDTEGAE
ncbi:hypothetical protein L0N33_00370 [Roseburia faecis]|nr:hypothetical protein [Roseburia faecis]